MCIGFQLLVLHQYARTRCVCDFSDLLLCVPFSLRLPIAHISCTSMARYLNAFSTLCHFFCLSISFSRSFFISNVFRWTVLFYSKQNIFSPFGRFLPDNFEVYRIFFCHYCCCCCCPIEPIFFAPQFAKHNDRSWIWCVMRFPSHILLYTNRRQQQTKKWIVFSLSSFLYVNSSTQCCQNQPIYPLNVELFSIGCMLLLLFRSI